MTTNFLRRAVDQRGAILIQVAIATLGILAFSALVVDYGIMWAARRQAQNVADAAALAAANSLAFHAASDWDRARLTAEAIGESHRIFGAPPAIDPGEGGPPDNAGLPTDDISFPACPPGASGGTCVRVNVYRDADRGNPLPTFLARIFNRTTQNVRATATAEIASGNAIKCLLPFAIIDRWADNYDEDTDPNFPYDNLTGTAGWSPTDDFESGVGKDVYVGPYAGNEDTTTGWSVAADYGRQFILQDGPQTNAGVYGAGWRRLVYLPGGLKPQDAVQCDPSTSSPVGIATEDKVCDGGSEPIDGCLDTKNGQVAVVGKHIEALVDQDPDLRWKPGVDGQPGAIVDGNGNPVLDSPRIRPIAIVDINSVTDDEAKKVKVANILGFFVEGVCDNKGKIQPQPAITPVEVGLECEHHEIVGRLVTVPGTYVSGVGSVVQPSSFVKIIRLVR